MSPAVQWFSKRIYPKSPTSDNFDRSLSADKLSLHSKNSDGFRFSNFTSVVGKRSKLKKLRPTLAIPDCPVPPLCPPSRPGNPPYTNRPPPSSVSSTIHSGDDFPEPRSPPDVHRDRGSLPLSLLTLSDPDPFAAGAISVPKSILERSGLSVCSTASPNNIYSNGDEVDLASTSSHSHSGGSGIPSLDSTWSPLSPSDSRSPWSSAQTSVENETVVEREYLADESACLDKISKASLSKYGSLSTLTGHKGSPDSPVAAIQPTIRTRCHTEGSPRSSIVSRLSKGSTPPSPDISFRSFTHNRQQSLAISCISTELSDGNTELPSSTVYSGSFTSNWMIQDPLTEDIIDHRYRRYKEISSGPDFRTLHRSVNGSSRNHARDVLSSPAPPALHQLKKSMSHSTLQKARIGPRNCDAYHDLRRGNKEVKRQHSFHQSHRNTSTPMPAPTPMPLDHESCRKPSVPHPQAVVRKRLFSGSSRRPSTAIPDEDMRSVFSLPTEEERYVASTRAVVSLLDEPSSDSLASGMVHSAIEFAPQHIMSPAEMLKVEAIVQDEFDAKYGEAIRNRQRGISTPSTPMYGATYMKEGMYTASTSFPRLASIRNAPTTSKGPTPTSSLRPSTAQTTSSLASMSSTSSSRLGLPHPPRSRTRPRTAETIYDEDLFGRRTSTVPFVPLSPPPPRLKRPNRASSIMSEKVAPHRSVMRKPSFLEITDDASSYDGNFLEFDSGKESLDLS